MSKFTNEFIAQQLEIAEKATPRPWLDLWKKPDGLDKEAYNSIKNNDGIEVLSVEWYDGPMLAITENNSAYLTESTNHYPDALREIARLREALELSESCLKTQREATAIRGKKLEAGQQEVERLQARIAELEEQVKLLQNYVLDGYDVVDRAAELMTNEQIAQWEGVAMWQVSGPLNGMPPEVE